jgi:hypothetical protein
VPILEKAFSKLWGNYNSIKSGFPMYAGETLLGTGGNYFICSNVDAD